MTLRTRNRGRTGLKDTALARFGFFAHLRTHVMLAKGVGAASFTRATVATVKDFEGGIRNCLSGEVRFEGQRRVRNLCTSSESTSSWSAGGTTPPTVGITTSFSGDTYAGCTLPTGVNGFAACAAGIAGSQHAAYVAGSSIPDRAWRLVLALSRPLVGSESIVIYCTGYAGYFKGITLNSSFCPTSPTLVGVSGDYFVGAAGSSGTNTIYVVPNTNLSTTVSVYAKYVQVENTLGQSNQNPSEYVSVGAAKLNEFTNSEDLTAVASWAPTRTTVTANGYQTLDTVLETAVVNAHELASAAISGIGASTAHRLQFECKPNGRDEAWVQVSDGVQGAYGVFNATTGAFTTAWQGFGPSAFTGCSSTIESRGDGVYRVTLDFTTAASTAAITTTFYLYNAGTSYLGDVAKGWYLGKLMLRRGTGDYFAVGNVYPYHGACVDGVKYFDYENGNTVSSNVVTEAVGRSLDGYAVAQLPGATGAYFGADSTTANSLTGTISITADITAVDWTPAAYSAIVSKLTATSGYELLLDTGSSGKLVFVYGDGSTQVVVASSVGTGFTDGTRHKVRADRDPATGNITFYTSEDGATWTQLGTVRPSASGSIAAGAAGITIGHRGASTFPFTGAIHSVRVYSQYGGTPVLDFNPREGWTENLLQNSDTLSTTWTTANAGTGSLPTLTTNYTGIAAPDGTFTAHRVQVNLNGGTAGGDQSYITETANVTVATERYASAVWLRTTDGSTKTIEMRIPNADPAWLVTINGTWTRVSIEMLGVGGSNIFSPGLRGSLVASGQSGSADFLLWHPQLRRLSVASQRTTSGYLPTTTAALRGWISSTGEQWTINGAATVLQRQAEGYLSELSTTNLVLQSSNFGTTWAAVNTPTRVAAAKYCGDIALDLLGDDDAGLLEYYRQTYAFTGDGSKSHSFVVAQGTSTSSMVRLRDDTAAVARMECLVTWANGVPVASFAIGSQERPPEALGNGCYRIFALAAGVVAANTHSLQVMPATDAAISGTPTGNIYIGGVQAENATVASSLQPTTTGTSLRNIDSLTWPSSGNYGAVANSLYGELFRSVDNGTYQAIIEVDDGSNNNRNALGIKSTDTAECYVRSGGVDQADVNSSATMGTMALHKMASVVYANYAQLAADGVPATADTSVTIPVSPTTIRAGAANTSVGQPGGPIKNLRVAQVSESNSDIVAASK